MNYEYKSIYFEVFNVIPSENISSLMKYLGLSYPTHFLKIAGSGIGDNFLVHSFKQTNIFARRIVSQTLFATNKSKHIFNRHIRWSVNNFMN